MQSISFYLYSNRIDVYTNSFVDSLTERYRRVYNRNLKIYRGVNNKIDFQVKNSDQKKTNINSSYVVFNLINKETKELILKKDCVIQDGTEGIIYINLTENELISIEPGFYGFTLYTETRTDLGNNQYRTSNKKPLYIDSQYGVEATVEIGEDVSGEPVESFEINEFSLKAPYENVPYYVSSIINANPNLSIPQSWHTFQFVMNNYSGTILIEASQSDGGNPQNWAIAGGPYEITESDSFYTNIQGKFNWFRIKHTPDKASRVASFGVSQTMLLDYLVEIGDPGLAYSVGDTILIQGNKLGGELVTNDLTITVTSVDLKGRITDISWSGISYNGVRTFVLSGITSDIGSIDTVLYR
jgi:hypothetical protein